MILSSTRRYFSGALIVGGLIFSSTVLAQGAPRISLSPSFLKVEWVPVDGNTEQIPIVPQNVADPNVELKFYGASAKQLLTSGSPDNPGRPFSAWSGECEEPFAITFRRRDALADLTGLAKMRWIVKTSGFHVVRPVIKLADGTMLVGDVAAEALPMMTELEFTFAGVRWVRLDPERVVTVNEGGAPNGEVWVEDVDLSQVDEIGFADLMPASGHGAGGWIHLGNIEVFGETVARRSGT
jgi:hypothetical protein